MMLAEAPMISNLLVFNDMPTMTSHDEEVPEVALVEEVTRVPGEVTLARRLVRIMRPCLMVMILIIVMIDWLVNLVLPFIYYWIQGCPWGPDDDHDDQDPRGGHEMVISNDEDSMATSEDKSISGFKTDDMVPSQVMGEADGDSISGLTVISDD